jgi:hypothetical protein
MPGTASRTELLTAQRVQRVPPRDHAEQHDADRPDVGAVIDLQAADAPLLRGHVRHRAHDRAVPREAGLGHVLQRRAELGELPAARQDDVADVAARGLLRLVLHDLRDAEVEHLHGAGLGDEDVVGLEIAVDDAELVRGDERAHDRDDQLDRAADRELLAALDQLLQRLALQVLEHHEGRLPVLADLVDDDDVLVAAARGRARLDEEALRQLGLRGRQELDRDAATELGVAREVDHAHAALAELADQLVLRDAHARTRRDDQSGCLGAKRARRVTARRRILRLRRGLRRAEGEAARRCAKRL